MAGTVYLVATKTLIYVAIPTSLYVSFLIAFIVVFIGYLTVLVVIFLRLQSGDSILDSEIQFSFSDDEFRTKTSVTKSTVKWDYIREVGDEKNYFLIRTKQLSKHAIFVPKRVFSPEQRKKFINLLNGLSLLKKPMSTRRKIVLIALFVLGLLVLFIVCFLAYIVHDITSMSMNF